MEITIVVLVAVFVAFVFLVARRSSSHGRDVRSGSTRLTPEYQPSPESAPPVRPVPVSSAPEFHHEPARSAGQGSVDLSLLPKEFVVVDLETTGLCPEVNEIIEIGAIRVNRDSDRHPSFQSLVKPAERVPKKITQLTGITQAMVESDGVPLSEALAQLKAFIGELPIVTFNAAFDMGFIWRAAKRHGVPMENRYTCALKLARRAYPGLPSYRLVDLAKMGNLSDENTHRSLGDCMRTVPIFMGSVMKIGERIVWEVPKVDWRVSVQYQKERDANRAFAAETRALEKNDPELAITRYLEAMARMYEYERLVYSWRGDDQMLDRLTLVLAKMGRYEELTNCVDSFVARFPEAQSSTMEGVLKRKHRAEGKLEPPTSHPVR